MATEKKSQKSSGGGKAKADSLWRKPITLDSFDDEDPLATLYRGREAGDATANAESKPSKTAETAAPAEKKPKNSGAPKPAARKPAEKSSAETAANIQSIEEIPKIAAHQPRMSETELKDVLRIRSESFHFTDLREILRGKSFEIYAYLRFLSGDSGVCKIKHLDLMRILDISRPTLFKQGEWLMRLSLIEKRNVPGDHLGTSYTVRRLEDVLPVSDGLVKQLESQIESFRNS
jgi:hypothetical protein